MPGISQSHFSGLLLSFTVLQRGRQSVVWKRKNPIFLHSVAIQFMGNKIIHNIRPIGHRLTGTANELNKKRFYEEKHHEHQKNTDHCRSHRPISVGWLRCHAILRRLGLLSYYCSRLWLSALCGLWLQKYSALRHAELLYRRTYSSPRRS